MSSALRVCDTLCACCSIHASSIYVVAPFGFLIHFSWHRSGAVLFQFTPFFKCVDFNTMKSLLALFKHSPRARLLLKWLCDAISAAVSPHYHQWSGQRERRINWGDVESEGKVQMLEDASFATSFSHTLMFLFVSLSFQ